MAPTRNASVIFKTRPEGFPIPGEHLVYTDQGSVDLETLPLNGGVLVKALALSVDPYLRNRMKADGDFVLGESINGWGVGVIIRSESQKFFAGDHAISNLFPFQEYAVLPETKINRKVDPPGFAWTTYVGVLGMPGQTAYVAYKSLAKAVKGETIYVSSGAGAVGSLVIQLAKADGLKVIASAGSPDKVAFLEELGADVAFNYKTESIDSVLKEHGPIDVYWDSVGGKSLETVLYHMNEFGRIVSCGSISQYNTGDPYGVKNLNLIYDRTLTMSGFRNLRLVSKVGELNYRNELGKLLKEGKLKFREDVRRGLHEAPQLFLDVQKGNNTGKAVIIVADD